MHTFKFEDEDIESTQCEATYISNENFEAVKGFVLSIKDTDIVLTASELDYMMEQVNKL